MKAMIFAAGLGTRLKPLTDNKPKAMVEFKGKPLLQHTMEYLISYGVREFVVNVHHYADQITDFLNQKENFGCKVDISDESDDLLETGGGLKKASQYLTAGGPFLVMNVDILTNLNISHLLEFHNTNKSLATLAVTERESSRYFLFNRQNELCGWKNTKTGEVKVIRQEAEFIPKAFSGIHVINPEIFDHIKQKGRFSIVETYLDLCSDYIIKGFDHSCDILIDVGKPESLEKAEKLF